MHILVIDDDGLTAAMICAVLEEMGHQVLATDNADGALAALAQDSTIDLIVSDLNMPGQSGIELFRQLRTNGISIPFILLTGGDPADPQLLEPRLNACLSKDDALQDNLTQALIQISTHPVL